MTLVIITALAIIRERKRVTMENLLSTPVKPMEVMIGKIVPYIAEAVCLSRLLAFMATWPGPTTGGSSGEYKGARNRVYVGGESVAWLILILFAPSWQGTKFG